MKLLFVFISVLVLNFVVCLPELADYFRNCRKSDPGFDTCVLDGMNAARVFIPSGYSKYNISSFDPFAAGEVYQTQGNRLINYEMFIETTKETGWSTLTFTKFQSDFNKSLIEFGQHFPNKYAWGKYRYNINILGNTVFQSKGLWSMNLTNVNQTTTIRKVPKFDSVKDKTWKAPLSVNINVKQLGKLSIRFTTPGRRILDDFMGGIIIGLYRANYYDLLRPIINDLTSKAFIEIYNKNFRYFPAEEVFR